jgi:RND family efflux transporter MFP subunit
MLLVGLAAGEVLWPATPVRAAPVLVKTDTQGQQPNHVVVQAPGWVEPDPFATAVSALAGGVAEEVLVLEGEHVEAGQVVARLVDEDARIAMNMAEAALAERQAALAIAQTLLREAHQNWEFPIELTRKLQTAEAQLAEKRAELAQWPAELAREEAHAVYMQAEYERIAPLHEQELASDIEFVKARQAHEAQQAQVEAVRRRKPILEAQIQSLEADLQAARKELRLRIADTRALAEARAAVQRAEAAVAAAEAARAEAALRLDRMQIRSPKSGIVMTRLVEPGSKVMLNMDNPRSAQVVRLYDPEKLQVRVDVPLVDAAKIGVGQPAEIVVDVLPDRVFQGHLTRIVHEADVQKNTLQVKVAIEEPSPELKPEMLARARFLGRAGTEAGNAKATGNRLLVPREAIFKRDGQSYVWLADQVQNTASARAVNVGSSESDGWMDILEGLRAGDRVILNPPQDLEEGERIRLMEDS